MGDVVSLQDYKDKGSWRTVYEHDDGYTELYVYVCDKTNELEIFQISDGKGKRTCLSTVESARLLLTLQNALK